MNNWIIELREAAPAAAGGMISRFLTVGQLGCLLRRYAGGDEYNLPYSGWRGAKAAFMLQLSGLS